MALRDGDVLSVKPKRIAGVTIMPLSVAHPLKTRGNAEPY
jgi:hypothetical protein